MPEPDIVDQAPAGLHQERGSRRPADPHQHAVAFQCLAEPAVASPYRQGLQYTTVSARADQGGVADDLQTGGGGGAERGIADVAEVDHGGDIHAQRAQRERLFARRRMAGEQHAGSERSHCVEAREARRRAAQHHAR